MLLLLLLGPVLLPEFRDPKAGRLDLISVALSLIAVLAVIYGIKRFAEDGPGWWPALAIMAGAVVGAVFVRRQRGLVDPLIDLRLFRSPAFSASLGVSIAGFFVAFATFLFIAQYLQLVLGMEPLKAGLWTAPSGLAFIVGSLLTPAIVRRVRPAYVMAVGLALAALGFAVLTQVGGTNGVAVLVTGYVVFSAGLAPVFTLTTDMIIGSAPPERAGAAAGIAETSSELGGALGIAVLGSIVTAVYRNVMADVTSAGMSPEAAEIARSTFAGARSVGAQLPDQPAAAFIASAQAAFTEGFAVIAFICAAAALAAAILALLLLRQVRAGPAPEAGQ
jgi:DHA2 family multidrug resistance protein-like MFS transporter